MDRQTVLARLRAAVEPHDWMEAAWIGGSDAFGRADMHSDIDLQLLVPLEKSEAAFERIEAALGELGGISAVWRVPEPAWHGHRQRFYQVQGLPETCMVDLCVMRREGLEPFLDPDRHGAPVIWFDRVGALSPVRDETLQARFQARLDQIRARYTLLAHMPEKALARGQRIEAVDTFQRLLFGPLVEVLRARYAPRRQDYGLRYLREDLPPAVVAELEHLVLPADEVALATAVAHARRWLGQELDALHR